MNTLRSGLAAAGTVLALTSGAQAAYPEKPINFIVPFGAGSTFDTLARKMGESYEKALKVPIVVKVQPGSAGRRGAISIFKSKPDGYTIGWTHFVPFLSDIYLRGKKPAIDLHKVEVIYRVAQDSMYIYVNKKSKIRNFADLKATKRSIKFASTGVGSITWVMAMALGGELGFGTDFVLGYKKLADAALAVAKGDAEAGIGADAHFRAMKDELRPLMYYGPKRDRFYPEVPSGSDVGLTQLTSLGAPRVVTAPPGTPKARLDLLRSETQKIVADPGFVKWATEFGFTINPGGVKETWDGLDGQKAIFIKLKPAVAASMKGKKKKM